MDFQSLLSWSAPTVRDVNAAQLIANRYWAVCLWIGTRDYLLIQTSECVRVNHLPHCHIIRWWSCSRGHNPPEGIAWQVVQPPSVSQRQPARYHSSPLLIHKAQSFNSKEHLAIVIMSSSASGAAYATEVLAAQKLYCELIRAARGLDETCRRYSAMFDIQVDFYTRWGHKC